MKAGWAKIHLATRNGANGGQMNLAHPDRAFAYVA